MVDQRSHLELDPTDSSGTIKDNIFHCGFNEADCTDGVGDGRVRGGSRLMIPTSFRAQISSKLSYPVGSEVLSNALAGAPHVDELRLTFYAHALSTATECENALRLRVPIMIAEAKFRGHGLRPGIGAWADLSAGWLITIYPVLRTDRSIARALLREQGLPAIRQWLASSTRKGWESVDRALKVTFDPQKEVCEIDERELSV